jgi:tetratricopeptide (TPR) repeat protein
MDWVRFQKATALRDSGRAEDAVREFHLLEAEVGSTDERAALLMNEHTCYCDLGRLDEAQRLMTQIHTLETTDLHVRLVVDFGEACMHIQMGQIGKGLSEFQEILARYPDLLQSSHRYLYESIQRRRGVSFCNLNRRSEALPLLREASAFANLLAEDKQEIHFYLGICYDQLREWVSAKEHYLQAIGVGLKSDLEAHAQYRVALIYFNTSAFAQAKHHLEAILQARDSDIPNLPKQYIYEQLSRTCHYLGEEQDAQRYASLARHSEKTTP